MGVDGEEMMHRALEVAVLPNGALLPEFVDSGERFGEAARQAQEEIFRHFDAEPESWLLLLGFRDGEVRLPPSLEFWRGFAGRFVAGLSRVEDLEEVRERVVAESPGEEGMGELLARAPMMTGGEYLTQELLEELWAQLGRAFRDLIGDFDGTVEDFFHKYSPRTHLVGRVFFHLVENARGEDPFAFLATYSTRVDAKGASKHLPLRHALQEYEGEREKLLELLSTVHAAARESSLIEELLESGEIFHPLSWSSRDAYAFLRDIPIFERAGILCRIPNWWTVKASQTRVEVGIGEERPAHVGMEALLGARPRLFLGDVELSVEEARLLLQESEGLALLKNRWVAVDPEKLEQALAAYDRAEEMLGDGLTLREALRFQLNPDGLFGEEGEEVEIGVSSGEWLGSVMRKLFDPKLVKKMKPPASFRAELREYQKEGLSWLGFLDSLQLGACLADDMGLGKTVQVLAFLSGIQKRKTTSLLVIPASLIANWQSEIERFAPKLKFFVAHPEAHREKGLESPGEKELARLDLVITTYALVQRYAWLQDASWDYVILDEAQAIKNPGTKQTRSVKKLQAKNRIILTGTPVENRLSDLWSLFDFLNPGLLGNAQEFKKFCKTLKEDTGGYARLRSVVGPYILRRLKTDRSVIADLPDKVEMKSYAPLSKRQVVLYEDLVGEIREKLEDGVDGIQRRGLILASLMKFKQLCNHPDQYLGTGGFAEKESGKFGRLREICETVFEKRERLLVFTQFKEITGPLHDFLAMIFGRQGLVLHGSVAVGRRKGLVEQFQNPEVYTPFMVLSLKAGGVGLNLTEANHVVHFDRWWNPAVENQATDRAFRIGQQRNVVVHKFLTRGTIEERIDEMLVEKAELFERVVGGGGESLITEMDDEGLMEALRLRL